MAAWASAEEGSWRSLVGVCSWGEAAASRVPDLHARSASRYSPLPSVGQSAGVGASEQTSGPLSGLATRTEALWP